MHVSLLSSCGNLASLASASEFFMKNLAIIIGITDYQDTKMLLPACSNDVAVMEQVCRIGGRFDEVINIAGGDSESLKSSLADAIDRFGQEDIDHLFFYFTGHGDYVDEDFRYQLRDYDKSRVAQTSLSNAELDGMLHGLSPNVLVKVVDACYSGVPYIKDGTSISNYLTDEIKGAFPRCYFFFSSQSDQQSFAETDISDFTAAFVASIAESRLDTVRYKHVMDFISDSFASRRKQIPQFVVQGSFTDVLGDYSSPSKEQLKKFLEVGMKKQNSSSDPSGEDTPTNEALDTTLVPVHSLVAMARKSAQRYVTMDDAKQVIADLQTRLASAVLSSELDDLYVFETSFFERYLDLPNEASIGKWLKDNASGEYFATPTHTTETYEAPRDSLWGLSAIALGVEQPTVTNTRRVIGGITTELSGMPFLTYVSTFTPRLPNLLRYKGWFTFLLSKTTIQIFYCFAEYREISWSEFTLSTATNWSRKSFPLAAPESPADIARDFHGALLEWVAERTRSRLLSIADSEG
jgi:hypothetical protein